MMIRKQGSLWDILDAGYSIFFLKELFLTQYNCLLSSRYILTISSYIPSDCYATFLNYYDDFLLYSLE